MISVVITLFPTQVINEDYVMKRFAQGKTKQDTPLDARKGAVQQHQKWSTHHWGGGG